VTEALPLLGGQYAEVESPQEALLPVGVWARWAAGVERGAVLDLLLFSCFWETADRLGRDPVCLSTPPTHTPS
jgi:hypothetical protein